MAASAGEKVDADLFEPHPAFKEFNDYFHFDGSADLFKQSFRGLRNIPGTAAPLLAARISAQDPSTRDEATNKRGWDIAGVHSQEDLAGKINYLMNKSVQSEKFNAGELQKWMEVFKVEIDVDRIARLAISNRRVDIARFLVDHYGADLKSQDILGRSAIFYAFVMRDLNVPKYIATEVGPHFMSIEMARADVYSRNPVHYGTSIGWVGITEYCFATAISDVPAPAALYGETDSDHSQPLWKSDSQQSKLLEMLKWRLESYRDMPLSLAKCRIASNEKGAQHKRFHSRAVEFDMDDLQSNLKPLEKWVPDQERGNILYWLHVPWTNGLILFAAFRAIEKCIQRPEQPEEEVALQLSYRKWFLQCFTDSPTVPGDPKLNFWKPGTFFDNHISNVNNPGKPVPVFIVFPCLILRSKEVFTRSRKSVVDCRDRIELPFARNALHVERSLDEAYYPSFKRETLDDRNGDQVVSRECRELLDGKKTSDSQKPILVVSQLWIWGLEEYILSAYSAPQAMLGSKHSTSFPRNMDEYDQLIRGIAQEMAIELAHSEWEAEEEEEEHTAAPAHDLTIGLLLANQIDRFGKADARAYPSTLDIFEAGVANILSDVDDYIASASLTDINMEKERGFIHDISDIQNELAMIDEVLVQQCEVLIPLINRTTDPAGPDWQEIKNAREKLDGYRRRVTKINGDAERVAATVQNQLDLKRTHASMKQADASAEEARISRRDAHTSLLLSTAVIGFTIITIVFAPIAFMATLFALPIDRLATSQVSVNGKDVFSTNYIGKWFAVAEVVSIAVTAAAVALSLWLLKMYVPGDNNSTGDKKNKEDEEEEKKKKKKKKSESATATTASSSKRGEVMMKPSASRDALFVHSEEEGKTRPDDEEEEQQQQHQHQQPPSHPRPPSNLGGPFKRLRKLVSQNDDQGSKV